MGVLFNNDELPDLSIMAYAETRYHCPVDIHIQQLGSPKTVFEIHLSCDEAQILAGLLEDAINSSYEQAQELEMAAAHAERPE